MIQMLRNNNDSPALKVLLFEHLSPFKLRNRRRYDSCFGAYLHLSLAFPGLNDLAFDTFYEEFIQLTDAKSTRSGWVLLTTLDRQQNPIAK